MGRHYISVLLILLALSPCLKAMAQDEVEISTDNVSLEMPDLYSGEKCFSLYPPGKTPFAYYGGSISLNSSTSGDFAPYYIMSNNEGLTVQAQALQATAYFERPLTLSRRFEYGFGVSIAGTWSCGTDYARYIAEQGWTKRDLHYPGFIIHNLYGTVKYRGVYASIGAKPHTSTLFHDALGSGDIVLSDNARPIPQISIGFVDFQEIPFTNKWVQIKGEVSYGKFLDNSWLKSHYNYFNSFITTGAWMQYSNIYFRSNPDKPFSATIGIQHATQFGGTWQQWDKGELKYSHKEKLSFKSFWNAFIPGKGGGSNIEGENFVEGNHLGSYDIELQYRFSNNSTLRAYAQLPWEDGSGMGKLNGFDGVWGLEYKFPRSVSNGVIKSLLAEYIDFTNQSGPMHWAPGDFPGTQIPGQATGADDYYNNFMYNGWTNYGMALGSPFVKSPVYNTDGYLRFTDNRVRGFQIGAKGFIGANLEWIAKFSYRTSWGTPMIPQIEKLHDTSMLLGCDWRIPQVKGLLLSGKVAFDAGKLYGNNFGAYLSLSYKGHLFTR